MPHVAVGHTRQHSNRYLARKLGKGLPSPGPVLEAEEHRMLLKTKVWAVGRGGSHKSNHHGQAAWCSPTPLLLGPNVVPPGLIFIKERCILHQMPRLISIAHLGST